MVMICQLKIKQQMWIKLANVYIQSMQEKMESIKSLAKTIALRQKKKLIT